MSVSQLQSADTCSSCTGRLYPKHLPATYLSRHNLGCRLSNNWPGFFFFYKSFVIMLPVETFCIGACLQLNATTTDYRRGHAISLSALRQEPKATRKKPPVWSLYCVLCAILCAPMAFLILIWLSGRHNDRATETEHKHTRRPQTQSFQVGNPTDCEYVCFH